ASRAVLLRRTLSGIDTKRTSRHVQPMSAFGGKADMDQCPLFPRKQTSLRARGMSALCQKRTSQDQRSKDPRFSCAAGGYYFVVGKGQPVFLGLATQPGRTRFCDLSR